MAAPRIRHMGLTIMEDPTHGELRIRMITKAMTGSQPVTVWDVSDAFNVNPQLFYSSPENASSEISVVLATTFAVIPASARKIAREIVRFARRLICIGGEVRFGLSLSINLKCTLRSPPLPLSVPEISVGPGLSKTEASRLKRKRFNGENKSEADAEVCSVCLGEHKEGDVITPLGPSCSHRFHNKCIVKWLKRKPTCPVCRSTIVV
ncbi:unnamed protein product [Cuscuta epithymum]|uniref:RING-type domain-containing protein n=1 Tax=Cuscuta epithymum TaxID=186058 RepID=A0AAV0DCP1_9ASTE|nr:unnamed protein product [Cuscuta epithymum]